MSTTLEHVEKWKQIEALDLSSVRAKLESKKSWWWLMWNDLDKIEKHYRQFLYLIATNPGRTVVPWTQALDDFWHEHILDTKKYADDCKAIFGEYLHHNPHLPKGTHKHDAAFKDTKTMYKEAFGNKKKNEKEKVETDSGAVVYVDSPGCSAGFIAVFCSSSHSHSDSGGSHCSSHSDSGSTASSCSSGSSCGGGSSCGSSCGGGCGGGGD